MGKKKGAFNSGNSVTLRLFQGANEGSVFEVVKVSGEVKNIDIDALVDRPEEEEAQNSETNKDLETFDGYFPDDGYDYAQHLRDINQERFVPAVVKPASKKPEDPVNKDLAEVMAALESADKEEEITEEFFSKLGPLDERTRIGLLWGEDQVDEYLEMPTDKLMAIQERIKRREMEAEKQARLASEQTQEDAEFDAFFAREFGDAKIGSLNPEDVQIDECQYDEEDDEEDYSECSDDDCDSNGFGSDNEEKEEDFDTIRAEGLDETKRFISSNQVLQQSVMDAPDDGVDIVLMPATKAPEWDCESVLSTRSNIFNHPGMIFRPPKEKKRAAAVAPVIETVIEEDACAEEGDAIETPVISTFRPKNESAEERKARKQAVKQFQREQREAKHAEKKKQKELTNKAKMQLAYNKHANYGDVQSGVAKFAI